MAVQTVISPSGDRLVLLPESDYLAMIAALEDMEDIAAAKAVLDRIANGQDEFVPGVVVERLLSGVNRVTVWREHRGMTISELAAAACLSQPYVSQIESGARSGGRKALAALALALRVDLEDLVVNAKA